MKAGFMKIPLLWVITMWSGSSFPMFWKKCCLHLQGTRKQQVLSKYWQLAGTYCVTAQKTVILMITTTETSNLTSALQVLVGTLCGLCHQQYQHDDSESL